MKASELRIGSIYQSVKFRTPVTLTAEDIYNLVANAEGADISHYIDDMISPLPLTEEWLLKFGFVVNQGYSEVKYWIKAKDGDEWRMDLNNTRFYAHSSMDEGYFFVPNIKHVHQLQNLYFALTGEELTLNKPTE